MAERTKDRAITVVRLITAEKDKTRETQNLLLRLLLGLGPLLMTGIAGIFLLKISSVTEIMLGPNGFFFAILLSQLIFFLALYFLTLIVTLVVISRYAGFLESRLHYLLKDQSICWDSKISPQFLWRRSIVKYLIPLFWIIFLIPYVVSAYVVLISKENGLWLIGFGGEIAALIFLLIYQISMCKSYEKAYEGLVSPQINKR